MLVFNGLRDSQARYGFRNETVGTESTFLKGQKVASSRDRK